MRAYILIKRDENDVHDKHGWTANVVFYNVPPVILTSNRVSALAPVVEGQASAPDDGDSHDMV